MPQFNIQLFGRYETQVNGALITRYRSNKVKALLAFLVVDYKESHARDAAMTLLWPDIAQKSAQLNLRQTLYRLRGLLPELVVSDKTTVRLNPDFLQEDGGLSTDTLTFDRLLKKNEQHAHHSILSCPDCLNRLEQIATLYRGTFLGDFYLPDSSPFETWAAARREQYQRRAFDALSTLTKARLQQGSFSAAEKLAHQQLALDPLRESAHRQLIEALARNGQRDQALAHFEQCRQLLYDELGMQPARRTLRLVEQIAADEIDLSQPQTPEIRGYELLEKLGEGAYGVVHRAYQPMINRAVAVKIIQPRYANRPDFIRRFEAEAQTVARLEHPFILPLYDFWREADGAFLVMRYMRGGSLADALANGDPWTVSQTLQLVDQIGAALSAAHQQGVIHRDLKPANILRDEVGNNYLADFGIARHILDGQNRVNNPTPSATYFSTSPYYTSPEQLQGAATTPQSDIYTLGYLLFELLTGQKPFPNQSVGTLIQHHLQTPLPSASALNPQLPSAIDGVLNVATAKQAEARFPTVPAFVAAVHEALSGVAQSSVARPLAVIDSNPYKGLRAFQEEDAALFFGRNQLIKKLLAQLNGRFLAVVGPSGSGKSSVVKAGLLPALRDGAIDGSDQWFVTEMVPGSHPFEELEAALLRVAIDPPSGLLEPLQKDERGLARTLKRIMPPAARNDGEAGQLLLVIDQFEELFTLVEDAAQRHQFIDTLLAALAEPHGQLRVIVTLRADFYDQPLQLPQLARLMEAHTVVVTPLDSAELEQVIVQPATLAGIRFEDGLIPTIIDDVRDQPGMLPLLQYALTELYEKRDGNRLTQAVYSEMSGIRGVLGKRAEEIFGGFSPENQAIAKQFFLRLVTLGEGSEDTRRRVLQSELKQLSTNDSLTTDNWPLLTSFGSARLLSFDHDPATRTPTVEVAHEALLREWARLRGWLSESREDLRLQRRLGVISAEYTQSNADPSFLLRGGQLQQFEDWATTTTVALTGDEQRYLDASINSRVTQSAAEETRRQRELDQVQKLAETERQRAEEQTSAAGRLRQRAYLLAGALAIAAVLATTAFLSSGRATDNANAAATAQAISAQNAALAETREAEAEAERDEANEQRKIAEEQARLALARELSANVEKNLSEDSELSLLLAMQSLDIAHTYEGEAALHRALQSHRIRKSVKFDDGIPFLREGPNGWLAIIRPFDRNSDMPVTVWDVATETKLYEVPFFTFLESVNRDGTQFATSHCKGVGERLYDCEFLVRDLLTGAEVEHPVTRDVPIDQNEVVMFLVHPDWEYIVIGMRDGRIKLKNIQTGPDITLENHEAPITGIGFSETTSLMITADASGKLIVWDLAGTVSTDVVPIVAEWQTDVENPSSVLNNVKTIFERNDQLLIVTVANNANEASVWRLEEGEAQLVSSQTQHTNSITDFSVSDDGSLFASTSQDGTVRVTDMQSGEELFSATGNRVSLWELTFIENDTQLLGLSQNSQVFYWDAATSQNEVRSWQSAGQFLGRTAASADGRYVAAGYTFGPATIYDVDRGATHLQVSAEFGGLRTVAFHPNSQQFATGGHEGLVRIHDLSSGELLSQWQAHKPAPPDSIDLWQGIWGLEFSPDGLLLATTGDDNLGKVWSVATGELLKEIDFQHRLISNTAFSPDGRLLAFHGGEAGIAVYDVASMEQVWRFEDWIFGIGLAFSPDSSKLVASGDLGKVIVWDMATGEEAYEMPTLNGFVSDAQFTPDGEYLVTGSDTGATVWDAATGDELFELADGGILNEFIVTSENHLFGGNFVSGKVAEFTLYLDDALALARERLTRGLTEQECLQYLRSEDCLPFSAD